MSAVWQEDLLINGTSFKGITGVLVDDWGGLLPIDVFRGDDKTLPGMPGVSGAESTRDAYDFAISFSINGTGVTPEAARAALLVNIGTIRGLFTTTRLVTLTQRLTSGVGTYADLTCNGKYLGLTWTDTANPVDISGVISFRNLDGEWT